MGRGQEQSAPVRPAPGEIADEFRHPQLADQLALDRIDPDAAGAGDPEIAFGVAFHPVGNAGLRPDDAGGEDAWRAEPPVRQDVEDADIVLDGVVDEEPVFRRAEAESVGLVEQVAVDDELRFAAARRNAVYALESQLARPLDAEDGHASVPRVREVDRAVRLHDDIVRAVQLQPLEMRGQDLAPTVRAFADQARGRVLADDEIQLGIEGHAVAFVRRPHDLVHAPPIPAPAHIARHVREQQMLLLRMPDGPLAELEAAAELADRRPEIDELGELRVDGGVRGHGTP